jgi:hypothetical protein
MSSISGYHSILQVSNNDATRYTSLFTKNCKTINALVLFRTRKTTKKKHHQSRALSQTSSNQHTVVTKKQASVYLQEVLACAPPTRWHRTSVIGHRAEDFEVRL